MIKAIRLINVQSFKDITLRFNTGVNVLEAPNETGKSIIFKVFRRMCDINWYGRREKKALIRRGCEKGLVTIVVDNGDGVAYNVQFVMFKTYQTYKLLKGKELIGSWKQDTIPDEVKSVLGWYYDEDSMRLINLLDQELDMPFVNNNNRSNYEIMKFITHDIDLDTARYNINQWIDDLTRMESDIETKEIRAEGELESLPKIDEFDILERIRIKEQSLNVSSVYANMIKSLDNCCSVHKPIFNEIDSNLLDTSIDCSVKLYQIGKTLQDVIMLKKPCMRTIDSIQVETLIELCKLYNNMRCSLININKFLSSKNNVEMKIKNVKEHIEDFEIEHKFCPLCGSKFNNKEKEEHE